MDYHLSVLFPFSDKQLYTDSRSATEKAICRIHGSHHPCHSLIIHHRAPTNRFVPFRKHCTASFPTSASTSYYIQRKHTHSPFPPSITFTHIIVAILLVGFNIAIRLFLKSLHDDERLKELERERLKAELKYLKYQLNPHFFMNTLNNIHTLIDFDKEKAQKSIIELSKLMQYVLYEADKGLISLPKEVQFLEHYLKLMQLRYTDKLQVTFHTPLIIPDVLVPPLLFISLLENAFTHGISHCHESFIEANISIEANTIYFTCKNSIATQPNKNRHQGIGLPNIQKRLKLLFGNDYTLDAEEKENQYHILLIIPAL